MTGIRDLVWVTYMVYAWFVELQRHFACARAITRMVTLESGFRLALPGETAIRGLRVCEKTGEVAPSHSQAADTMARFPATQSHEEVFSQPLSLAGIAH